MCAWRGGGLFQLVIQLFGLSKNLSSPSYGNAVVTAVTLAIVENGSTRRLLFAQHAYSAGTAWAQHTVRPLRDL